MGAYVFIFIPHFALANCFCSFIIPGNNAQEEENVTSEELKDNRALVDNNTAQSLTGEDIDEMRRLDTPKTF